MEPYLPKDLPINNLNILSKLSLIIEASNNLARYDEKLKMLPNPKIFLSPLQHKEAVKSSQIEGTQTTFDQVLKSEADIDSNIRDSDLKEVLNYRRAMEYAINNLNSRPLSLNMLKQVHSILLEDVRGNDRVRGNFRKEQVWIGPEGCLQEEAKYVPPIWEKVIPLLTNWENYIHTNDINPLVQTAIMHAQFELIHPFVDGNGRVGRILLPLYMYQKALISEPMFYLSGYLEKNREKYVSSLSKISVSEDWDTWIEFFLIAVNEQAKENLNSVNQIMDLYQKTKDNILITRSRYQTLMLDALFMFPFFTSTRFSTASKISDRRTAIRIVNKLEELGIIQKITKKSGSRPAMYIFPKLYEILRK